jgi:hypothetical protein
VKTGDRQTTERTRHSHAEPFSVKPSRTTEDRARLLTPSHDRSHLGSKIGIEKVRVVLARDARVGVAEDEGPIIDTATPLQPAMAERMA